MDSWLVQLLTLLRLIAFMVLIYLGLGWLAERYATRPDSKVKAFFRTLCSPVTRPVARHLAPGSGERRVLAVSMGLVAGVWVLLIVVMEVGRR
jgi:uncharacterized protein YggT (Ycf19 family)